MRVLLVLSFGLALTVSRGNEVVNIAEVPEDEEVPEDAECSPVDIEGEEMPQCGCRDSDSSCLMKSLAGLCTDATVYSQCRFSCSYCSCSDNARDCEERSKTTSCSSSSWMRSHCKKTCRLCSCADSYSYSYCQTVQTGHIAGRNCHSYGYRCAASCGECSCEDLQRDCQVKAARGECVYNSFWMLRNCKRSCNQCLSTQCKDNLQDCESWINSDPNACQANPEFMNIHCAKACKICTAEEDSSDEEEETGDCVDQDETCVLSARLGQCQLPEIQKKCPFSCRTCVCGDLDQRCGTWAEEGKCFTQPAMMRINCKQTCEFCACQDKPGHEAECLLLAAQGKCMEDPDNMALCPRSCNVCECGDNYPTCMVDAVAGKCQSEPARMLNHCAESCHQCNLCGDNPPLKGNICGKAKQRGYCETEPLFRIHCAKTCGVCTEGGDSSDDEPDPKPDPNPDPDPSPWRTEPPQI
ncbi:hypothetical protein ACHWQZ_G008208 [Mnemiopsis leidyi]